MLVLVDYEWFTDRCGEIPVQLAAIRVDQKNRATARFSTLFACGTAMENNLLHVAFCGHGLEEFAAAPAASAGFRAFSEWLQPDDVICAWHKGSLNALRRHWNHARGTDFPYPTVFFNKSLHRFLNLCGTSIPSSLYACAELCGVSMAGTEHCAEDDVALFHALLSLFSFDPNNCSLHPLSPTTLAVRVDPFLKKEYNQNIIKNTPFQYLYAENSNVFHTKNCSHILFANNIHGSIYYDTAAKTHRPCKICCPQKPTVPAPPKKASKPKDPDRAVLSASHVFLTDKQTVRLIDGTEAKLKGCHIGGICHAKIHPGVLSCELMKQHRCIQKECRHFEKRVLVKTKKEREKQEQSALDDMLNYAKSCLRRTEEPLIPIRMLKRSHRRYRLLYVSENDFPDNYLFPKLQEQLRIAYPQDRIELYHIIDENGYYVTTEEYRRRIRIA